MWRMTRGVVLLGGVLTTAGFTSSGLLWLRKKRVFPSRLDRVVLFPRGGRYRRQWLHSEPDLERMRPFFGVGIATGAVTRQNRFRASGFFRKLEIPVARSFLLFPCRLGRTMSLSAIAESMRVPFGIARGFRGVRRVWFGLGAPKSWTRIPRSRGFVQISGRKKFFHQVRLGVSSWEWWRGGDLFA